MKYRGIDKITGKRVYGRYHLLFDKIPMIEVAAGGVEILPDSVEKLVAIVKGKEIYKPITANAPALGNLFEDVTA